MPYELGMSRPKDWVDDVCIRQMALLTTSVVRPLTSDESLDYQRMVSLLDAWELWDCGKHLILLGHYLRSMDSAEATVAHEQPCPTCHPAAVED